MNINTIVKVWSNEIPEGQYYFNIVPFEDIELSGWKFSISGPGNNGHTLASFLVDDQEPMIKEKGIYQVVDFLYKEMILTFPGIDLVCRATY